MLAIDSRDALLALKMANGTMTNPDVESALQWIAADVNKSGSVSVIDSWLILRELIGIDAPHVGEWQLINSNIDMSSLSAQQTSVNGMTNLDLTSDSTVQLVGLIYGDIDGSWGI
jgi:hypothetical protein